MPDRRAVLRFGLTLGLAGPMAGRPASGTPELRGGIALPERDDTPWLQAAIDRAARQGARLDLPAGRYRVSGLIWPGGLVLSGVPGATRLEGFGATLALADRAEAITIADLILDLRGMRAAPRGFGAIHLVQCRRFRLERIAVHGAPGDAVVLDGCQGRIGDIDIAAARGRGLVLGDAAGIDVVSGRIVGSEGPALTIARRARGEDLTTVRDLRIEATRGAAAVLVSGASGARLADLDVVDAGGDGIAVRDAHAVAITGARLRRIAGAGVAIGGESRRVRVSGASIEDARYGILDRGAGASLLTGNAITRTRIGIALSDAALARVVEANMITNAADGDVVSIDADGRPRAGAADSLRTPG